MMLRTPFCCHRSCLLISARESSDLQYPLKYCATIAVAAFRRLKSQPKGANKNNLRTPSNERHKQLNICISEKIPTSSSLERNWLETAGRSGEKSPLKKKRMIMECHLTYKILRFWTLTCNL